MATLKEKLDLARTGKLSKEGQAKLKDLLLSGKLDPIAESEGLTEQVNQFKAKFGKEVKAPLGFMQKAGEMAMQSPDEMTALKGEVAQTGFTGDIEEPKPEKAGVLDVLTGNLEGKQNVWGETIPEKSALTKNMEALTPVGITKAMGKGVIGAMSGGASLFEKAAQKATGVEPEYAGGAKTAGEVVQESEALKPTSGTEGIIKTITQVVAPLLVTGGISGGLTKIGTSAGSKGLTALGASEKTAKALSGVAGGLTASPFQTAMVTGSLEGELPTVGELGIGAVLDAVIPGYRAVKALRSPTFTEAVEAGIVKGVKPSLSGKQKSGDYKGYLTKAEDAVKTIVANKSNLNLVDEFGEALPKGTVPQNLQQFSDAIEQTKSKVFEAYDNLAQKTGATGVQIQLDSVAGELQKIVDNKALQKVAPEMVDHAQKQMSQYLDETLSPSETQEAIQALNAKLQAFYKNPTASEFGKAKIDALIANQLRDSLDSTINEVTEGGAYQELKNLYGSLKAIQKDVLNRTIKEAIKANKSLIDFSDIFSAGDVVSGVLTGNPATIAKGFAQKALSSWYKTLNSPNKIVQNMFTEADKLLPASQITEEGLQEVTQNLANTLPETMTGPQVADIITQLVKALTLGVQSESQ